MKVEYLSLYKFRITKGKIFKFSEGFSAEEYSQFKYGESITNARFSKKLYDLFITVYKDFLLNTKTKIFVVAPPYLSIPAASTYLAQNFTEKLNGYLKQRNKKNVSFLRLRVERYLSTHPPNYAELNIKERKEVIKNIQLVSIRKKNLKGATVILLDDCYMTGSTTKNSLSIFKSHKVKNVFVLTVIRCVNKNSCPCPELEFQLNHTWVSNPRRFLSILLSSTSFLTIRAVRFFIKHQDLLLKTNVLYKMSKKRRDILKNALLDRNYNTKIRASL